MEIYKIEHLSFTYPNQDVPVLNDLSFSVEEGEFLTICGLSGCGKSTLLRNLKTSLCPHGKTCGNVFFMGRPLSDTDQLTQAEQIGFVMQSPDDQTVTDKVWHELAFGPENLGVPSYVIRRKVAEIALFFGFTNIMYNKISELSGGQKQLLNLASVMIQEPSVLILDEPVSQLDPAAAEEFIILLDKIHREFGTTVILCEHTLEQICTYTDRIIVMNAGKIDFEGTPQETAKYLYRSNDPLFESMPVSARITAACTNDRYDIPMTVGEGKRFLTDYVDGIKLKEVTHEYYKPTEKEKPIIKLKNIFFRYKKDTPDVLKGLSFSAWKGEITAITGGNGSGKTTLLKTIADILHPYSGSLTVGTKEGKSPKICLLPQDPRNLFLKESVEQDLLSAFSGDKNPDECTDAVKRMLEFCGLEDVKYRHPYDLSGGEQQKAALAKVLLYGPDVLLLDEPVKGMDVRSKSETGEMLRCLAKAGVCVIMVSHDIEFCAEYADRCAFFFDGDVVGTAPPDSFFSKNTFFTTPAAAMAKNVIPNAVTANDIRRAISVSLPDKAENRPPFVFPKTGMTAQGETKIKRKSKTYPKILFFFSSVLFLFYAVLRHFFETTIPIKKTVLDIAVITLLLIFLIVLSGKKSPAENISIRRVKQTSGYIASEIIFILTAVPITIFIGIICFGDAKYLFISLLIMLECTVPFLAAFEKSHIRTRELVLIAVMCAMAVTARAAFYMFPQLKPITAIVIIAGASLGAESGFLVGSVSMLVSNILFGQGPWTPWQMFAMGMTGFLSGIIFGRSSFPKNKYSFAVFGFFSALLYGGIMNPAAIIMSHMELSYGNIIAFYATGLPPDVVHGVSTALFLFLAAVPMIRKIERVKLKYGLICEN